MSRSEKKASRRFLPLVLLFAALLLAAAFVFLLPEIKQTFPADDSEPYTYAPTYQTLAEFDETTLKTITVTHLNGEQYTLVYQDGLLSLTTPSGELEPISALRSENFIKYATTIYVEDTIAQDESEVQDQLSAMGLAPPEITATATFTDGSEITLFLGDCLYDTTYHYYQWSGDNGVYLCNTGAYEAFDYTADMLRTVTQPMISASLVERVSIQNGDGELIVCSFETDETQTLKATLQSPFLYPMDSDAAANLLTAVDNFRLGIRLLPLTEETRAMYGLDTPSAVVTIHQRGGVYSQVDANGALKSVPLEPSVITLALGSPDGDFFRYCEYEGVCYRVSGFLVSAFLKADAANYTLTHPADMGTAVLQDIIVHTETGELSVHATYQETVLPNNELATDENGEILYTTLVTCNGEPAAAEAFEGLSLRLKQMAVSGALSKAETPQGLPRWQLSLTTVSGEIRTLAAYPMDSFRDMLAVDGVALHTISNEALEIALGEFTALINPVEPSKE